MHNNQPRTFFSKAVIWYTGEIILCNILLAIHQMRLFVTMERGMYGKLGVLFGVLYCAITVVNGGLDSIMPVEMAAKKNNAGAFKHFFLKQVIPTMVMYAVIAILGMVVFLYSMEIPQLAVILPILFFVEGCRRIVKHILSLLLFTRFVAIVEVIVMASYVGIVWGSAQVTPASIFFTMTWCTAGGLVAIIPCLIRWYKGLSLSELSETTTVHREAVRNIIKKRLLLASNDYIKLLFSTHYLTIVVGIAGSYETAALIKYIGTLLYTVTTIIKRILITAIDLAYVYTTLTPTDLGMKIAYYSYRIIFILGITIGGGLLLYVGSFHHMMHISTLSLTTLSSLGIAYIILFDSILQLYERYLINTNRSWYAVLTNGIAAVSTFSVIKIYYYTPITHYGVVGVIIVLLGIKMVALMSVWLYIPKPEYDEKKKPAPAQSIP